MRRKRKKRRFISRGAVRLKTWRLSFYTSKKTALENVEWLLYYAVPACESKKFSAYVGKTLIQSAAVFIFVVQSFIRDGICLKSKAEQTIPLPRHLLDELSPEEETGFLLNSYTDLSRENPVELYRSRKIVQTYPKTMRCRRVYRPRLPRHLCNRMARIPHFYRFDCPSPRIQKN